MIVELGESQHWLGFQFYKQILSFNLNQRFISLKLVQAFMSEISIKRTCYEFNGLNG